MSWLNPTRQARESAGRRASGVQLGDRFVKVTEVLEESGTVWMVAEGVKPAGLPPHVRLIDEKFPHRAMTVAVSALYERHLYRRAKPLSSA